MNDKLRDSILAIAHAADEISNAARLAANDMTSAKSHDYKSDLERNIGRFLAVFKNLADNYPVNLNWIERVAGMPQVAPQATPQVPKKTPKKRKPRKSLKSK